MIDEFALLVKSIAVANGHPDPDAYLAKVDEIFENGGEPVVVEEAPAADEQVG